MGGEEQRESSARKKHARPAVGEADPEVADRVAEVVRTGGVEVAEERGEGGGEEEGIIVEEEEPFFEREEGVGEFEAGEVLRGLVKAWKVVVRGGGEGTLRASSSQPKDLESCRANVSSPASMASYSCLYLKALGWDW